MKTIITAIMMVFCFTASAQSIEIDKLTQVSHAKNLRVDDAINELWGKPLKYRHKGTPVYQYDSFLIMHYREDSKNKIIVVHHDSIQASLNYDYLVRDKSFVITESYTDGNDEYQTFESEKDTIVLIRNTKENVFTIILYEN